MIKERLDGTEEIILFKNNNALDNQIQRCRSQFGYRHNYELVTKSFCYSEELLIIVAFRFYASNKSYVIERKTLI